MTPEGRVKKAVREVLAAHRIYPAAGRVWKQPQIRKNGWYWMPVQTGRGVTGVHDFVMCLWGAFITIETKKPGGEMTENQKARRDEILESGGSVWQIDDAARLVTHLNAFAESLGRSFST